MEGKRRRSERGERADMMRIEKFRKNVDHFKCQLCGIVCEKFSSTTTADAVRIVRDI